MSSTSRPRKQRDFHREKTRALFSFSAALFPSSVRAHGLALRRRRSSRNYRFAIDDLPTPLQEPTIRHLLSLAKTIRQLKDDGWGFDDLAERFQISRDDARILAYAESEEHLRYGTARATDDEIVRLYLTDKSINDVARLTREQPWHVQRVLARHGVKRRPVGSPRRSAGLAGNAPSPVALKIIQMYDEDRGDLPRRSFEAIARDLGMPRESVRQIYYANGGQGRARRSG